MGWFDWLLPRRAYPTVEQLIVLCDVDSKNRPRLQVPDEWLTTRTSVASVQAGFAGQRLLARWLEEWQRLRDEMKPSDELWEFSSPQDSWNSLAGRAGYAVVRDGLIVDGILTLVS